RNLHEVFCVGFPRPHDRASVGPAAQFQSRDRGHRALLSFGMTNLLYLLLGLALGGVIGWLLGGKRGSAAPADRRMEDELRQNLSQRETDLGQLRDQLATASQAGAAAVARQASAEQQASE